MSEEKTVTFPTLQHFTKKEQLKLMLFGTERIVGIAKAFDSEIERAFKIEKTTRKNAHNISAKSMGGNPFIDSDEGDAGTLCQEMEMSYQRFERSNGFLKKLCTARKMFLISPEQYGHCVICGNIIPTERLEIVPHASKCIKCKQKQYK